MQRKMERAILGISRQRQKDKLMDQRPNKNGRLCNNHTELGGQNNRMEIMDWKRKIERPLTK